MAGTDWLTESRSIALRAIHLLNRHSSFYVEPSGLEKKLRVYIFQLLKENPLGAILKRVYEILISISKKLIRIYCITSLGSSRLTGSKMPLFETETIHLLPDVSIVTVALSGITMVIATARSRLTSAQAEEITVQLRMATFVTTLYLLLLVARRWGLEDRKIWQFSKGAR